MPQVCVRETISSESFSVDLIELIAELHGASIVASTIQLARCAPVDCYSVICSHGRAPRSSPPHHGLFVEYAAAPSRVKYMLGRFNPVHSDNLLAQAWQSHDRVKGISYIPSIFSEAPCEIRPEHPTSKMVTDNLDNFSNRGDSHRLSTPSTHKIMLLPLLLLLRRSPALRLSRLPKLSVTAEATRTSGDGLVTWLGHLSLHFSC
jgi:hypothetical protein